MTAEICLKIFKRISDDDISFMGFSPIWSRPELDDLSSSCRSSS